MKKLYHRFLRWWFERTYSAIVVEHEDLPAHHGDQIQRDLTEDLLNQLKGYRNYPNGRGFRIFFQQLSDIPCATDDKSIYRLNRSNKRWICIDGPDLDLPRNENGDCNE